MRAVAGATLSVAASDCCRKKAGEVIDLIARPTHRSDESVGYSILSAFMLRTPMSLTLYYHPLSSFCHKVLLLALYENETPFRGEVLNLQDRQASAQFLERWPLGKIPVLYDARRERTIPETSIIIEYLQQHFPGAHPLLPSEPGDQLETRLWDRFFDLYVQVPMQKIVGDRLRAADQTDPIGVEDARSVLRTAYGMIEKRMADRTWIGGPAFSLADCAAAPALFYATTVMPLPAQHPGLNQYFERLMQRKSMQQVIAQARPFFDYFPYKESIPKRFL
jgi:glutathione S-transferase